MHTNQQTLKSLRIAIWKKVFGTSKIIPSFKAYESIRKAILQQTGYHLSKDTIKNFIEKKHTPAPQTLDIYSTFVMGGNEQQGKTYSDFAESLMTQKRKQKSNIKKQSLRWGTVILLLLLFMSIIQNDQNSDDPETLPSDFFNHFQNSNLDTLRAMGWSLYEDSIDLSIWNPKEYQGNGFLTLATHLGDTYLNHPDFSPKIANTLRKAINCGPCCDIRVKIVDFNPTKRYQQGGFFLFYDTLPYPSIRTGLGDRARINPLARNGKYSNAFIFSHASSKPLYQIRNDVAINPIDSVVLSVTIKEDYYVFRQKKDVDDWVIIGDWSSNLPPPLYLGLYACQGRPDLPSPVYPVAPVIPVKFEYAMVQPCD